MDEGKKEITAPEQAFQNSLAPTEKDYEESLEREKDEETIQIISFYLGRVEFAFELTSAVEILKERKVTEVPRTPEHIKGILSVRGEMIPVFDLKKRLGIDEPSQGQGRIFITVFDDLKIGFLVDRMGSVKDIPVSGFAPEGDGKFSLFSKGRIVYENGVGAPMLDVAKLVNIPEAGER